MTAHIHKDKIIAWASNTTQRVWCRQPGKVWNRIHGTCLPIFDPELEYYVGHEPPPEPDTFTINGTVLNAPWRVEPSEGTAYFIVAALGTVYENRWDRDTQDVALLASGNCWKTQADAKAFQAAKMAAIGSKP